MMNGDKPKIIRATTVPMSLKTFCNGMLRELSEKYEVVALSSPGEDLSTVAEREGVRTIAVPMERHISLSKDLKALVKMIKVLHREQPTMVHSMTPKAGLLCMIAAWLTRVPVRVHTFTGLVWPTSTGLKRKILMATDRLTCACATHIIPEGEGVKNDLLKNGITKKPLKVLGYGNVRGVDMNKYSVESLELRVNSLSADDKGRLKAMMNKSPKFTFLFVGRIVRDKGIDELCAAFDKLSGLTEARLVLVGPYEDSLDPISEKSREIVKKNPNIECVGPKMGDELLAYYAAADCFVFPSYREGFPNTVLEAGAMGLPSIVTDINGSREIIIPRRNGVIIPPRDADALFQAMLDMMRDKTARERMAANARQLIASRYEQSYVRQCLYDFYDEILG
jgi:glycosyltransferase involved in cell wall biosynthesis